MKTRIEKSFHPSHAAGTCRGRIFFLLIAAVWLMPRHAFGQAIDPRFTSCVNGCFNVCDTGPASLAWECRERCGSQCEASSGPAPTPYGAIAYGTRGSEGISWNEESWAAANQSAVATCSKYGSDCRVVYRFQNTCAALAVARGGEHVEAAAGNTEQQAKDNATSICRQRWGECASNLSACSGAGVNRASQSNQQAGSTPQTGSASWGALAYSLPDRQAGWSSEKVDQSLAGQEAMKACSAHGQACVLKAVFNKQCLGLARDQNVVGIATSADPREAQRKAVEACTKNGGTHCALFVFFCSL